MKTIVRLSFFCAVVALLPQTAQATTYYVAQSGGSDSNTCTQAQTVSTAKATINGAIPCMSASDTLQIRSGTYNEQIYYTFFPFGGMAPPLVPNGTSSTSPTRVMGYPGDTRPVLKYVNSSDNAMVYITRSNNVTFDGIDLDASGLTSPSNNFIFYVDGASNVTVQNSSITGIAGGGFGGNGFSIGDNNQVSASSHIHLNNLKFSGSEGLSCSMNPGGHTIYVSFVHNAPTDVVINGSEFTGWNVPVGTPSCGNGFVIQVYSAGCGSSCLNNNIVISNNYFHDNQQPAIVVGSGTGSQVYNNIFVNNGTSSSVGISAVDIGYNTSSNIQVYNNTFYNNATAMYAVGNDGNGTISNNKVQNNILYMNGNSDALGTLGSGATSTPNLIATNPSFVNTSLNNYHITSSSMARLAGVNLSSTFTTDRDGVTRPASGSWDDGAYQFVGTSCSNTNLGNGVTCINSATAQSSDKINVSLTNFNAGSATMLAVIVSQFNTGQTCTGPSSTPANTWRPGPISNPASGRINQIFYAYSASVSSSMTISCNSTGTGSSPSISVGAFSGPTTSQDPFDQSAVADSGGSAVSSLAVGPLTPTNSNQLIIVGWNENTGLTMTANNGFTVFEDAIANGTGYGVGFAAKTISTPAATNVTLTPSAADVISSAMASFATSPLCTGASPSLSAPNWNTVKNCLNIAANGDKITVAAGSYAVTTKTTVSKYVKIVPSGSVTLTDNTCSGNCPAGDHTANMIDINGVTTGSIQFGNITSGSASGFHIVQGSAIHSNPNGVIHLSSGIAGDGTQPPLIVGNDYTSSRGTGDFIVVEGDTGVLAYNSMTGAFAPSSNCNNNNAFARVQSLDSPWVHVSNFGSLDTNGNYKVYIEHNTMNYVAENIDVKGQGRVVFRFNTLLDSPIAGLHGADTETYGGRYAENYNNSWSHDSTLSCGGSDFNPAGGNLSTRGGTMLVFNNIMNPANTQAWGNKTSFNFFQENIWRNQGAWQCWGTPMQANMYAGYPDPYQIGWGFVTGATQAGNAPVFMDREPIYIGGNTSGANYDAPVVSNGSLTNACGSTQTPSDYIKPDREYYAEVTTGTTPNNNPAPGNGSTGTGTGLLSQMPSTCTGNVGYWAVDQGSWNHTGSASPGAYAQGVLYKCSGGTFGSSPFYTPFSNPHPLIANLLGPNFTITQQPTNLLTGGTFSPVIAGAISTGVAGDSIVISSVSGGCNVTGTATVTTTAGGNFSFPGLGANGTPSLGCVWKVHDATSMVVPDSNLNAFNMVGVLSFTQQPNSTNSGSAFSPAVKITASVSNTDSLTLSVNSGTCGLTGTTTVSAVAGVTTFTGVGVNGTPQPTCTLRVHNNTNAAYIDGISNGFAMSGTLTFSTQPTTTITGNLITPAAVVTTNPPSSDSITITMAGSCTVTGATTVNAASGLATFAGIRAVNPGTNCNFTANDNTNTNYANVTSSNFDFTPRTMSFTSQPTNTIGGIAFSPTIVVTLNALVVDSITLSVTSGTCSITGTTTVNSVNGVATFTGLMANATGTGCVLTAHDSTAGGPADITSSSFNITAATTTMSFTVQPQSIVSGNAFNPAIQVTSSNLSSTDSITITVNGCGTHLSGTTTATMVAGVVNFFNISAVSNGGGCILTAHDNTSSSVPDIHSNSFAVGFLVEPVGAGGVIRIVR